MVRDVAALIGLALVSFGLWWIYPPIALVIGGGLLLAGSIWGHLNGDPR